MNEWITTYLLTVFAMSIVFNIIISLYGLFFKPNYVKKIIALTIFSDSANIFAIYIGYRRWIDNINPRPPVLLATSPRPEDISYFAQVAVDPLPQALVLTAIVIGLAAILFLVFLGYQLYRNYRTLDMREIRKLRG